MKQVFCLMAAAAIALAACNKVNEETPVKDPEIKLTSTEDITVSNEGGTAAIGYEIVNPVDGGMISAASQADWISDFNYDTEGEVTFTVAANTGTEKRNATVTLTYTYADGKTVNADANLVQDAYIEVPDPEIKIEETEISVSADGGQSEIAVEILNPAEDGEISATADESWITVTSATATAIVLDIAENTETSARSGEVSVTYTYAGGESVNAKITVNQEAAVPEPELSVPQSAITVSADGGQTEVTIEIINPAADGEIIATSKTNWITVTSASTSSIVINVDANLEPAAREGLVTVSYIYDMGTTINADITVNQEAKTQSEYDYEYVMVKAEGSYWTSGYNSYITFCDMDNSIFNEPNAVFYKFDIYSDGPNNRLPTAGTYTYNKQSYVPMTFGHQSSSTTAYDEEGNEKYLIKFAGGTVTISYEGDNMVMEGFLTDENGATHHITYNGPKPTL